MRSQLRSCRFPGNYNLNTLESISRGCFERFHTSFNFSVQLIFQKSQFFYEHEHSFFLPFPRFMFDKLKYTQPGVIVTELT